VGTFEPLQARVVMGVRFILYALKVEAADLLKK
jgi:hypothetical protein